MAEYGYGGGGYGADINQTALDKALEAASPADAQKKRNQQLQTPYAAENGMASAQAVSTPTKAETPQYSASATGGFTPSASPVTPTGEINPTTQEQYKAPVAQPAPAPAPTTPSPGPGWININGGWVPPDHPLAAGTQQFAGNATGVQGQLPQAPNAGRSVYGNYPARPANTNWTADLSLMPQNYQGATFTQAPQVLPIEQMQMDALQKAFAGNPLETEAMKARLREDAMAMAQQARQGVDQDVATRGTFGGGNQGATKSDITSAAISDILSGYRDIDIAAADRTQSDLLNAIGAGGQVAQDIYGRNLGFQQAQADETKGAYESALQNALSRNALTAQEATMNQANYGQDLDAYFQKLGIDTNADLTRQGYGTDLEKAKMAQLVNLLQLAQNAWSDENQLGYQYTALGQNALNNILAGW